MTEATLTASLLRKKIFVWRSFVTTNNTSTQESMVCSLYSCHKRPNDRWRFINSESFGNRLLNPYHIFQVRFAKELEPKMLISTELHWFKIREVTLYNDDAKFLNLISIQIPSDKFMLEMAQKAYASV